METNSSHNDRILTRGSQNRFNNATGEDNALNYEYSKQFTTHPGGFTGFYYASNVETGHISSYLNLPHGVFSEAGEESPSSPPSQEVRTADVSKEFVVLCMNENYDGRN